jgi:hypothetical protein
MAEFGKAGAGNQADIAAADHRNAHGNLRKTGLISPVRCGNSSDFNPDPRPARLLWKSLKLKLS